MDIRHIDGREATNRRGAAEYLKRSPSTLAIWTADRETTGFPTPIAVDTAGREAGREWYALDELERFRDDYMASIQTRARARVHHIELAGDPDALIDPTQFAKLLGITYDAFQRYVHMSEPAWAEDRDGYLPRPRPEDCSPARNGVHRQWRMSAAVNWINQRKGRSAGAGRKASAERSH